VKEEWGEGPRGVEMRAGGELWKGGARHDGVTPKGGVTGAKKEETCVAGSEGLLWGDG